MGIEKLKHETAEKALRKALELQEYLELGSKNPIGTLSSSSAGVCQMTNEFSNNLTRTLNTAISDDFVRSLRRDTDIVPQN